MFDIPLALAFAGGLVATVNPCGFAMLPAYLSFLRSFSRYANRVAGGLLVAAGGYIVFFWTISLSATGRATPGVIQTVDALSSRLTNTLGSRPLLTGAVLVAAIAVAVLYGAAARRRRSPQRA